MATLQIVWFCLIAFLAAGYAILDGFDLGAGFWHLAAKSKRDRNIIIEAIGPFWDGNEVWLITAAGALFAAFPPVYATVFSGFYLVFILILVGLILRICAIEFRDKIESARWVRIWDVAFAIGSTLPTFLFGVALANLVRGIELNPAGYYAGGVLALFNPYALLIGGMAILMFALHGALFIAVRSKGTLMEQATSWARKTLYIYIPWFGALGIFSLINYGSEGTLLATLLFCLASVSILGIGYFLRKKGYVKAFLTSGLSIALTFATNAAILFPDLIPARNDNLLSLTLFNSSSSFTTLATMLIIALIGMPLVIAYGVYLYRIFWVRLPE